MKGQSESLAPGFSESPPLSIGSVFKSLLLLFFAGVLLWFGVSQIIVGSRAIRDAWESPHWPHTVGKIVASGVDISRSSGRHSSSYSYSPKIVYRYTAGGQDYTGRVVMPGRLWGQSASYSAVARFPAGTEATVYYSAVNPSDSLLEPGFHRFNVGTFLAGIELLLFGSVPLAFACRGTVTSPTAQSNLPLIIVPGMFIVFGLLIWLA